MNKRVYFGLSVFLTVMVCVFAYRAIGHPASGEEDDQIAFEAIVDGLLKKRQQSILEDDVVDFGDDTHLNILVLGLDSRQDTDSADAHCDAIHMFELDIKNWKIKIISVPRGTYSWIPGGPYAATDYYLANACAFAGLDYGVSQIENIVGVKSDYVVTVGFSQVMGIARLLGLPSTETLQWLRHRHSYQIGDPQRSHNQAVFMKDLLVGHLDLFRGKFSIPMQYVFYTMVDTDMDFATARALLNGYLESNIDKRQEHITLEMRPWYATVDYHFNEEQAQEQIDSLSEYIGPFLSHDDFSGMTFAEVQAELVSSIRVALDSGYSVKNFVDHTIWLQIEDEQTREIIQFDIVSMYAAELARTEIGTAIDLMTQYIFEKEALGLTDWTEKGKEELENMLQ